MVVDVKREKIVGEIPDTAGVHGIALAPKLKPRATRAMAGRMMCRSLT